MYDNFLKSFGKSAPGGNFHFNVGIFVVRDRAVVFVAAPRLDEGAIRQMKS
jgi:hypothetical protein